MDLLYLIVLLISLFLDGIDTIIMKGVNLTTIIDSSNILFTSEEVSLLACAQRCRFRHKDAAIRFQGKTCTCFINDDFEEIEDNHGTVSGIFLEKKMKKMKAKINGAFGNWKNSTNCTKPCGIGTLVQVRACDSPKPENGGDDCDGVKNQTVECIARECPINGGFGSWNDSTSCTKSCGTLEQIRLCDSPKPAHGGADCDGIKKRMVECNTHDCQVVNVALGKTTNQSSIFRDSSNYSPSKAVDGVTYTRAITNFESNPWWEIELGEIKVIKRIRLNAPVGSIYNLGLVVETGRKGEDSWMLCADIGDQKQRIKSFKCTNEQSSIAQFLRIRSTKAQPSTLLFYEVEILGY